jgi:hypothetical protein
VASDNGSNGCSRFFLVVDKGKAGGQWARPGFREAGWDGNQALKTSRV